MTDLRGACAHERRPMIWEIIHLALSVTVALLVFPFSAAAVELPVAQCAAEGNLDKAIEDCSTVISGARDNRTLANARYNRAEWYARQGRPEQAISDLTEAIRLQPTFAAAYTRRGLVLELISDQRRARADYASALKLPITDDRSHWAQVTARDHIRDLDRAPLPKTPVVVADNSKQPLLNALDQCNAKAAEAIKLPGAKGEIQLNKCYRSRAQFSCAATTLLNEANSFKQDYAAIAAAEYPNLKSIDQICKIPADRLSDHLRALQSASDRLTALRKEYTAQAECANSIEDSLRNLSLADMPYAAEIMKSMIAAVQDELIPVSNAETDVLNLADRLAAAQKALVMIEKIRGGICP